MRALLMHSDRDFNRHAPLPPHERDLVQDLGLETLLHAMAESDELLFDVARRALLSGLENDADTILYRQQILKDALNNPAIVRELYALAGEAIVRKKLYISVLSKWPTSILYDATRALHTLVDILKKLKNLADAHAGRFTSSGFTRLFAMLQQEFSDRYFAAIRNRLIEVKFRAGVLVSAELGEGNQGTNYVLRQAHDEQLTWLERLLGKGPPSYTFRIHERDEAGGRILSELWNRGVNPVANALAQSTDHILSFFDMLRSELAFYVGCLNLHDTLVRLNAPRCFPQPYSAGTRRQRCTGLYDVCLALSMGRRVVDNTLDADSKSLVIITGANQGGKSTFLRSIGLAQVMMQCGMFVPAKSFVAEVCTGVFTHCRREEDATMTHGKLDEELARMSEIADVIAPNAMLLLNESFASTNEREGSEIPRQVVCALLERHVKTFFVTHLHEFARGMFEQRMADAMFLRAERLADGTRTFRLVEGEPLETSYGEDLYREIFASETEDPTRELTRSQ